MIPHALHEYKAGYDLPEMVTNPINALWALGIRNKKNLDDVARLLRTNLKMQVRQGLDLINVKRFKECSGMEKFTR